MSLRYFYEFRGTDNVLNKVEIVAKKTVSAKEITAFGENPFSISYPKTLKLDPIQGSGFSMNLVSEEVFQFMDLHTDDMQEYMIRFYRAGQLYWIGYLDPELYSENLSSSPPYDVEFSGADFNIMERLTFLDDKEKEYTDINTLLIQLKRCLNKLALPFQKLYIGCSTIPGDVVLSPSETALHKLYIQSANFYDEDKEPMKCREVVESILQPFGLMMVQRDASIFIYDYNTIETGGVMKSYSFDTLSYAGDTPVRILLGDISEIGTVSTDALLGFEALVNNTSITSSLYASSDILDYEVTESNLSDIFLDSDQKEYVKKVYRTCIPWSNSEFILYKSKINNNTLVGSLFVYTASNLARNNMVFKQKDYLIHTASNNLFVNIKAQVYINSRTNPFDETIIENDERTRIMRLYCNLIIRDYSGKEVMYYSNFYYQDPAAPPVKNGWIEITDASPIESEKFVLDFSEMSLSNGRIANKWLTNSLMDRGMNGDIFSVSEKNFQNGLTIPSPPRSGYLELEMKYSIISDNAFKLPGFPQIYPSDKVKDLLVNNVEFVIKDADGKEVSTDDYEFKSYINKKVYADLKAVDLKCISANENKIPIGKANILRNVGGNCELQLSYTRGGQTNILERLLMCTIHSNYSAKNREIKIDLSMTENPMMRKVSYNSVLGDRPLLTTGCTLDFRNATTTIEATDFSKDFMSLSSIPYQ